MAPPAGTSSMLRSRRRDATLKPNRTLDRSASRGMLYENEELRLRTININAEVEKCQSYIKKLRRENEQLKREIWNLREEYERLENYVKSQDQSEEELEGECDGDVGGGDGEEEIATQPTAVEPTTATVLETVVEEDDASADLQRQQNAATAGNATQPAAVDIDVIVSDVDGDGRGDSVNNDDVTVPATEAAAAMVVDKGPSTVDECRAATDLVTTLTADELAARGHRDDDAGGGGGGECVGQQQHHHHHHHHQQHYGRLDVYDYNCAADDGGGGGGGGQLRCGLRPHPDEAVLQPHTVCFDIGSNRQLHDLTVDEVVNAIQDAELRDKLRTISLTDDRCYMTFANAECLERALHTAVLRIRDESVLLMDTGAGAVILSLTGVPDTVADKDVLKCLKRYGTIIGGVERKTGRGGTTGGERYVRIRPTLGAPRYLWFGSDKVVVRQLTEHETDTMNSVARRKSFRSHIKLNLKMADAHRAASVAVAAGPLSSSSSSSSTGEAREICGDVVASGADCGGGGGGVDIGPTTTTTAVSTATTAVSTTATAVSAQNVFRFPSQDPKAATGNGIVPATESGKTSAATATTSGTGAGKQQPVTGGGSMKRTKPAVVAAATGLTDGCPPPPASASSTGPAAESSPLRGRRRPSLMGFRRETIKHRGGSVSRADGGGGVGEDADSDTSPICRRKLSIKGHERAEKVPWCGCWGNGCL